MSLMYHSITQGAAKPNWKWALSFRQFSDHLSLLHDHGWNTIVANAPLNLDQLPHKSILITFDDGYADNILAFEELVKRNMTAAWFIVTKDLGNLSQWVDDDAPKLKMLDSSQLVEMHSAGMSIGSHTHTHCRLPSLSELQITEELTLSKERLSEILGQPVSSFAYPYGLYNPQIVSMVSSAGYQVAFTTCSGFGLVNNHPLEVRRVSIMADDSLSSFARKLAFAANDVGWAKMADYVFKRIKQRIH